MDEDMDLFYHALNYRGASSENAELFWHELQSCVDRLVAEEREACAKECEALDERFADTLSQNAGVAALVCASKIRMRSNGTKG